MDNIKKLGYKPNLQYSDEYESDIVFKKEQQQDQDGNISNNPSGDDVVENGNDIQDMIDKLPDFIGDIIKDAVDPVIDFVEEELGGKEISKVPVELDWSYGDLEFPDISKEDDPPSYDDPDAGLWDPDDYIPIKKEEHTKVEIIEKEYIKNIYDLFEEYYSNLHLTISKFWSALLYSIVNKSASEIDTILNNILLNSSEIKDGQKHLLDLSIKSEIHRNMKLKYFSNNFNAEETITHLKQFKTMYELRLRYAKIEKIENPKLVADQMSNNMLKSLQLSYDIKYDKAFENLYRYLKSLTYILDDSLDSAIQSIKAKQVLIDTKGVK